MRHIKNKDLQGHMSDAWLAEAAGKLAELENLPVEERSAFINDNGTIWSALKSAMSKLSHDKCWYSEVRLAPSELEIDHFRPKNRVTGSTLRHRGYWWLAFDWNNFRLAYSLVNKRRRDSREEDIQGKGCYFPLVDESARIPDTEPASTSTERPQLIDPCVASDIRLLDYAVEDGKVIERYKKTQNAVLYCRAQRSIDLFHLNEGTLIRDRCDLHAAIKHFSDRIEELEVEREAVGSLTDNQNKEYDKLINLIGDRVNAAAPFSSFARACLKQGGDRGWNTELLMIA